MSESTDPTSAVRTFAALTAKTAKILDCSYEDAAEFLTKLGPFLALMQDHEFRARLDRYAQAMALDAIPKGTVQ